MLQYSKLSAYKKKIIECFSLDLTATQTANLTKISRVTINRYYGIFREKISWYLRSGDLFCGEVELDESYFRGKHHKGKRGRGSENKIPY